MISEEWSSDCRRDVPTLARIAETAGLELRIFTRDGRKFSRSARLSPEEWPDGNPDGWPSSSTRRTARRVQSVPVVVFYMKDLGYHYIEYPAIYRKDRVVGHLRAGRPGEGAEETGRRGEQAFTDLLASPVFHVWACAAADEMLSALHERLAVGSLPLPGEPRGPVVTESWRGG